MSDPAKANDNAPMTTREEVSEFVRTAVVAIVLALIIRTLLIEPFNIPSGSMMPTLEVGDYLFVSKPAYGYSRFSFPFGFAPIEGRVMTGGRLPSRGDVIVFKNPQDITVDFIKRIIGLPGDRIQMKAGRLYINGTMAQRQEIARKHIVEEGRDEDVIEYIETLPGGIQHHIYEMSDNGPLDNTPEITVPDGDYFGMGDNRDNSSDSRVIGPIPAENIVGRAWFTFFSIKEGVFLPEVWKWPDGLRVGRMFHSLAPDQAAAPCQGCDDKGL